MTKCNKYYFLIVVLFIGFAHYANGQKNSSRILGSLDPILSIEEVKITYNNRCFSLNNFWNQSPVIEKTPVGNKVLFELPEEGDYRYINLNFVRQGKYNRSLDILNKCIFLASPDLNIEVILDEDTCVFKGEQRFLFEAQYRLKALYMQFGLNERRAISESMYARMDADTVDHFEIFYKYLSSKRDFDKLLLDTMIRFIDGYGQLPQEERDILKLNTKSELDYNFKRGLLFHSNSGRYSTDDQVRRAIHKFHLDHSKPNGSNEYIDKNWMKSSVYLESIYLQEYADLSIPLKVLDRNASIKFEDLYQSLNSKYNGKLLDRILATAFFEFGTTNEVPNGYYGRVLSIMEDPESILLVKELANSRHVGSAGFNFQLQDTTGNLISFNSLRGKVVVMDFWFTGCGGCASMTTAMQPVHEYFENNKDLVFVNISVDKDRQEWIESVRTGKFTNSTNLNLYTGGNGSKDEVIQYYKISAYPTLIIFDKSGKIAYYNPKGPFSEQNKVDFINRLKELL